MSRLFPQRIVNNRSPSFPLEPRLKMNVDYSYVGVAVTTQEAMAITKEDHDHPVESSETLTLTGPEAPAARAPTVVGPSYDRLPKI
jgi:hypothetical protein